MSAEDPWYVAAFRSDYRDVYPHRDVASAEPEARWLVEHGVRGRALDLGCGFGRHTAALRALGCEALGLDLSEELLRSAQRLPLGPVVRGRLVRGDARRLPFAARSFDAVVVLFSSFGYFGPEGDALVLSEVARLLRPAGLLVLDLMNPARVRATLVESSQVRRADLVVDERRRLEDGGRVVAKDVTLRRDDGSVRSWSERVRMYTLAELDALLGARALERESVHGGFDGTPFSDQSPRQIVLARLR